jgi:hypothetical protein
LCVVVIFGRSLRIEFVNENEKCIYFFVIDPPWRIVLDNKIIASSSNYPYNENDEKKQQQKEIKWFSKTNFMKYEKIKEIKLQENCDLIIEWENDAILNSFITDSEYPSCYFYDRINDKAYDFFYGKIIRDDYKSKYK